MYLNKLLTEEPSSLTISQLFIELPYLDSVTQIKIAVIGKFFKRHGTITRLANRYEISRPFVYSLIARLSKLVDEWLDLGQKPKWLINQLADQKNIQRLLLYRIVGCCSLSQCSTLLKTDGVKNTSVGWCSETLERLGSKLPNMVEWQGAVIYASDELYYSEHRPILITVEPLSGAILRIDLQPNLTKAGWEAHWQSLKDQGIEPTVLVSDEGQMLKAARQSTLSDVAFQPDTFHAITHQLHKFEQALLRKAHHAIEAEYNTQAVAQRAISDRVKVAKALKHQRAKAQTQQALETLEDFQWLYHHLRRQFKPIRSDGTLRCHKEALEETKAVLECFELLPMDFGKSIQSIRKLLPDLFGFLKRAKATIEQLKQYTQEAMLPFWLSYWQFNKSLINIKNSHANKRLKKQFEWLVQLMQQLKQGKEAHFEALKATIFAHLNTIVQSSSMVESANARIRPFIQKMRGQLSQQTLNLIMFYHNHCRFKRGKRKGKAPIELLKGITLDKQWIDLLMRKVNPQLNALL